MRAITSTILEMLEDDMLSHGLVAQCVEESNTESNGLDVQVKSVLEELLTPGNVEVGVAHLATPQYVEFVAWKGSVAERVGRAMDAVAAASEPDKEFAYWLCLHENVDRFETQP